MEDSSFGRLVGALAAPVRTFESIRERPTWLVPLLVFVVLAGVVTWIGMNQVDWEESLRAQMERSGREVPAGQIEGMVEFYEEWGGPAFGLVSALFTPLGLLLMAGAFFLLFRLLGSELTFRQAFATGLYALAPRIVAGLLSIPVLLAVDGLTQEELQGGTYLASSLAAFAPEGASPVTLALLSSVDFFSLWTVVLLVIGYAIVGRVSRGKAALVTIVLWGIWIAFKVGGALLQGAFGG